MICDLCKRRAARRNSLLCDSCSEGVSRLMLVAKWEAERGKDVDRNAQQVVLLKAYLKGKGISV